MPGIRLQLTAHKGFEYHATGQFRSHSYQVTADGKPIGLLKSLNPSHRWLFRQYHIYHQAPAWAAWTQPLWGDLPLIDSLNPPQKVYLPLLDFQAIIRQVVIRKADLSRIPGRQLPDLAKEFRKQEMPRSLSQRGKDSRKVGFLQEHRGLNGVPDLWTCNPARETVQHERNRFSAWFQYEVWMYSRGRPFHLGYLSAYSVRHKHWNHPCQLRPRPFWQMDHDLCEYLQIRNRNFALPMHHSRALIQHILDQKTDLRNTKPADILHLAMFARRQEISRREARNRYHERENLS